MSYTALPKNNKKIALKICWYRQRLYICYTNNDKQMANLASLKKMAKMAVVLEARQTAWERTPAGIAKVAAANAVHNANVAKNAATVEAALTAQGLPVAQVTARVAAYIAQNKRY